jgi:hypothetical protein
MPSLCSSAGNPPSPLRLVLDHLSSSTSHKQLYNDAARGLHRASKDHQAAARATLRHLPLIKYHGGVVAMHPDPSNRPSTVPWDLLAASPAATSWTLHPEQLEEFQQDHVQQLAAAAGQLRSLKVNGIDSTSDEQLQGLSRLLHACTQLQQVHITCLDYEYEPMCKPWLMMDPDSSSLSSAVCPPIPLTSWESSGVPYQVVEHWLGPQQQQPLSNTLSRLVMSYCGCPEDISGLAAVRGLRELQLGSNITKYKPPDCATPASFEALSSMGTANPLHSLTRLWAPGAALEAVCALTGLQHLSLSGERIQLTSSMSSMQQLTCLEVSNSKLSMSTIPDDLGVWLPKLQRLESSMALQGAVPASLTALTHLGLSRARGRTPLALPFALPRLKQLVMDPAIIIQGSLASVPALEVLEGLKCSSAAVVQPLTRLRRLRIVECADLAGLRAIGSLQQLSCLDLSRAHEPTSALVSIGPLAALQQLTISLYGAVDLGPWLAQCTALTKLCVVDRSRMLAGPGSIDQGDLGYLPLQLQELQLQRWCSRQLPAGVMRLAGLKALYISEGCGGGPQQLPSWMSQLRCLELLDISSTQVSTEQAVLALMPALRCVRVSPDASAAEVFGSATHLCFGGGSVGVE